MTDSMMPVTGVPRVGLPPRALVVGDPDRAASIARLLEGPVELARRREYHSFRGTWGGVELVVASHGVGAPGAAVLFGEFADAGVTTVLRLGTAGSLQPELGAGDLVNVIGAVRDDGLSSQLIPAEFPAVADATVVSAVTTAAAGRNRPVRSGLVWTRAALYPGLIDLPTDVYTRAGVLAVEMEAAALFVMGLLRGQRCGALLVLDGPNADELVDGQGYDPRRDGVTDSMRDAMLVALDAIITL